MAINIFSGFNPDTDEPIDSRLQVADESARLAIISANAYDGMIVYQEDDHSVHILVDASDPSDSDNWEGFGSTGYTLPAATNSTLGGVIVEDSSDIDIDSDGKLTLGNIDATKITTGDLDDDRLTSNVALLDRSAQSWSGQQTFNNVITEFTQQIDVERDNATFSPILSFNNTHGSPNQIGDIRFNHNGSTRARIRGERDTANSNSNISLYAGSLTAVSSTADFQVQRSGVIINGSELITQGIANNLVDLPILPDGTGETQNRILRVTGPAGDPTYTWATETTEGDLEIASASVLGGVRIPDSSDIDIDSSNGDLTLGSLDANKIGSGTFSADRIPGLNASKITAGEFVQARFPVLNTSKIPTLDPTTKLSSGSESSGRILTADGSGGLTWDDQDAVSVTKSNVDTAIGASSSGDQNKYYNQRGDFEEITKSEVDSALGVSNSGDVDMFYNQQGNFITIAPSALDHASATINQVLTWNGSNWAPADAEAVAFTLTVQDEGTSLTTGATTLNFTGSGVTASGTGTTKTINITGGGGGGTYTAGAGLSLSAANEFSVDNTVVRTTGQQSIAGDKTFTGDIEFDGTVRLDGDVNYSHESADFGTDRMQFNLRDEFGDITPIGHVSSADILLRSSWTSSANTRVLPGIAVRTGQWPSNSSYTDQFSITYTGNSDGSNLTGGSLHYQARYSSGSEYDQWLFKTRNNANPTDALTVGSSTITSHKQHDISYDTPEIAIYDTTDFSAAITEDTDLGKIVFAGQTIDNTRVAYGDIVGIASNVGNSSETGGIKLRVAQNGGLRDSVLFDDDFTELYQQTVVTYGNPKFGIYDNTDHSAEISTDHSLGFLEFKGETIDGTARVFGHVQGVATSVNDTSYDGKLVFQTVHNGTLGDRLTIDENSVTLNVNTTFDENVTLKGSNTIEGYTLISSGTSSADFDITTAWTDSEYSYDASDLVVDNVYTHNVVRDDDTSLEHARSMANENQLMVHNTNEAHIEWAHEVYGRDRDEFGHILNKTQLFQDDTTFEVRHNTNNNSTFATSDALLTVTNDQTDIHGHLTIHRDEAVLDMYDDGTAGTGDKGLIRFSALNDADEQHTIAEIVAHSLSVGDGTEDGEFQFKTRVDGGSLVTSLSIQEPRTTIHNLLRLHGRSSDPSAANSEDGDLYYHNSDHQVRAYLNGTWTDISGSGGGGGSDLEIYEGSTEETSAATRLTFDDDDFNLATSNNQVTIRTADKVSANPGGSPSESLSTVTIDGTDYTITGSGNSSNFTTNVTIDTSTAAIRITDTTDAAANQAAGVITFRGESDDSVSIPQNYARLRAYSGADVTDGSADGRLDIEVLANNEAWVPIRLDGDSSNDNSNTRRILLQDADLIQFDLENNGTFAVNNNSDDRIFSIVESSDTSVTTTINRVNGDTFAVNGATQFNHDVFVGSTTDSDPDLTVYGSTTLNGNVTLGNSNTDTITVNADVTTASTSDWVLQGDVTMRGSTTRIGNSTFDDAEDTTTGDIISQTGSTFRTELNTSALVNTTFVQTHYYDAGNASNADDGQRIYQKCHNQSWWDGQIGKNAGGDLVRENVTVEQDVTNISNRVDVYVGQRANTSSDTDYLSRSKVTQFHDAFTVSFDGDDNANLDNDSALSEGMVVARASEDSIGSSYFRNSYIEVVFGGRHEGAQNDITETVDGVDYTRQVHKYSRRGETFWRIIGDPDETADSFGDGTIIFQEAIWEYTGSMSSDDDIVADLVANHLTIDYKG